MLPSQLSDQPPFTPCPMSELAPEPLQRVTSGRWGACGRGAVTEGRQALSRVSDREESARNGKQHWDRCLGGGKYWGSVAGHLGCLLL